MFSRISFFVNAGVRFVTEMCKMRAFSEMWEEICDERYQVKDKRMSRFRYGVQVNSGVTAGQPVQKPIGFMSNSREIAYELKLRCQGGPSPGACSLPGGGRHTSCSGKIAREAAMCPRGL